MNDERKFFKSTITFVVLSEDSPASDLNAAQIHYEITEGECVLLERTDTWEQVSPDTMAGLLVAAGSEPGFFMLDDTEI